MRTRKKKYSDYGVSIEEVAKLKEYCKDMDAESDRLLYEAACMTEPSLADKLYKSLKNRTSYDTMEKQGHMFISKGDFYGYRRKCICLFRDKLIFYGKWK